MFESLTDAQWVGLSLVFVALLLTPVFDLPDAAGSIIEMSFAGGLGTIAGMRGLLDDAGVGEVADIGLGLATISILTGVISGTLLVNWAIRNPKIDVAREHTDRRSTASRLSDIPPNEGDTVDDPGLGALSRAAGAIAIAIFLGFLILTALRAVAGALGTDLFDRFPLFPFTVIGGFLVQLVLTRTRREKLIERRMVNDFTGLSLDILIASAIGTLSLATIGANIPAIAILTVLSLTWSMTALLVLGPACSRISGSPAASRTTASPSAPSPPDSSSSRWPTRPTPPAPQWDTATSSCSTNRSSAAAC